MWGDGKVRMRLFTGGGGVRNIFGQVLYRRYERRLGAGNVIETPIGPSGTGVVPACRRGCLLCQGLALFCFLPLGWTNCYHNLTSCCLFRPFFTVGNFQPHTSGTWSNHSGF